MIQVVLIDIDNTLLSFSGYIKEAMRDGFAQYGLKPYTEAMFPVFERINNSLWEQIEQGTLSFEKLTEIRWNMIFHALGISFDGRILSDISGTSYFPARCLSRALWNCWNTSAIGIGCVSPATVPMNSRSIGSVWEKCMIFSHTFSFHHKSVHKNQAQHFLTSASKNCGAAGFRTYCLKRR